MRANPVLVCRLQQKELMLESSTGGQGGDIKSTLSEGNENVRCEGACHTKTTAIKWDTANTSNTENTSVVSYL